MKATWLLPVLAAAALALPLGAGDGIAGVAPGQSTADAPESMPVAMGGLALLAGVVLMSRRTRH
ncbi:hypothetical protein [Lentzea sp. NPDC059081]|uniref:hypothetical protein n=1 Tax=Lentzea sp. NPDC059081 TaxID=3346719 RepID=UPI0036748576